MMKNRQPDGCREVLKLKIAIVTGASSGMGREFALQIPQLYKNLDELWVVARRTDRLKSLKEQVKIPVRIFDGDMQRDYIFEKLQRELDRRQADVRMLVNAAGYGKIGNVSDIDLKEQCGMVDLNCYSSAILMKVLYQLIITRHKAVVIDTDLTGSVGTDRVFDVGVFQNDETNAALCAERVIIHMTVTHLTACLTVVGSHRGPCNTVFNRCSFDGNWLENFWVSTLHENFSLFIT